MDNLIEVLDVSYSLPLFNETFHARNSQKVHSLDKILREKVCHVTCFTNYR